MAQSIDARRVAVVRVLSMVMMLKVYYFLMRTPSPSIDTPHLAAFDESSEDARLDKVLDVVVTTLVQSKSLLSLAC